MIELLVVVLIIGILSAVALPQYTKAVEKSRLSEAQTNISSLEKAVDMYNMAGGDTSERDLIPLLDVDFSHLPATPRRIIFYIVPKHGVTLHMEQILPEVKLK